MGYKPCNLMSVHLQRLDLLLHRQILRMRAAYQLSLDEFRGLYISDEQVDNFISALKEGAVDAAANFAHENANEIITIEELTLQAELLRAQPDGEIRTTHPWYRLRSEFNLSDIEMDLILLAVAPDLDTKYETIYAYLNNDVSRKWATFDLAIRIFGAENDSDSASYGEYRDVRQALLSENRLFRSGLLRRLDRAADRVSWLASAFTSIPPLSHYLLGIPRPPRRLTVSDRRVDTVDIPDTERIAGLLRATMPMAPLVVIEGRSGPDRLLAAEAVCEDLEMRPQWLDLRPIAASNEPIADKLQEAGILQRLYGEVLCIVGTETLFERDGAQSALGRTFHELAGDLNCPCILVFDDNVRWREVIAGRTHAVLTRGIPDIQEREALWRREVECAGGSLAQADIEALATRFALTSDRIKETAAAARLAAQLSTSPGQPRAPEFFRAAREQSGQAMAGLASKVESVQTWENLVLPTAVLIWVKQVAHAMRCRHRVFSQWGMGRRMGVGSGLTALFAGASGTGKTMTAGVIANDLGQDMYKIDLSGIVSKYIGETEKNLDRIFSAARESNGLLFFDEADALFGKRSEVKDAHDRYANIEVAYLLQKLEEYDGIVILATNLSKNIDAAFARRMNFVVDFPIPGEQDRERLWRGMFPMEAPVADDIDFPFLAAQFTLPGGDIKNTALTAAFLAGDTGSIEMKHIVRALARQLIKQGRIPMPTDFKHYYGLIAEDSQGVQAP